MLIIIEDAKERIIAKRINWNLNGKKKKHLNRIPVKPQAKHCLRRDQRAAEGRGNEIGYEIEVLG